MQKESQRTFEPSLRWNTLRRICGTIVPLALPLDLDLDMFSATEVLALSHCLFVNDDFQVDFFEASRTNRRLLFTFTEFGSRQLEGFGFGGEFALKQGYSIVAIKSKCDDWYVGLSGGAFDAIDLYLETINDNFDVRIAYGSSMGGYAGIMFAKKLRIDRVIALSPQYDIAQPWDLRWADRAQSIGPVPTLQAADVYPECTYVIAYDPADKDRLHYDCFSAVIPDQQLCGIRVRHAGHPVGYMLNVSGTLKRLFSSAVDSWPLDFIDTERRLRRTLYPAYFFNLAGACMRHRKYKWAINIVEKAIEMRLLDAEFRIRAAQIEEERKNIENAIIHASVAVAAAPTNPHMAATLARLSHRKGLHAQALHYIDLALMQNLANPNFLRQRAEILAGGKGD